MDFDKIYTSKSQSGKPLKYLKALNLATFSFTETSPYILKGGGCALVSTSALEQSRKDSLRLFTLTV